MEKLDRLGWVAGISFRAYGLRIGIRANNDEVLEQVEGRLPSSWKPVKSPVVDSLYSIVAPRATGRSNVKRFNLLYRGIERLARTTDLDEMLNEIEINMHAYVASATRQRMFLHAGVVGWRGQAIVIPGRNFSGKTNLVTALLRAGASYYSDEFAVLDNRGRVHPYPWVLHIREEGIARPKKCTVEMLGAQAGDKPLPVGVVVLSEYRQGAKWRPQPLSQGRAALAMLANVMSTQHPPEVMLSMLGQVVSRATVLKGVRGEAEEVVDSILDGIGN
jgi:hypothetical protein